MNVTLYYREGSSDKVYQVSLEPKGDGFIVNFAFGRRGSTLNTGTKTSGPVDYETAKKIYDKLVGEKTAKGYTPGEDGTPYQHSDKEQRSTGILPQLLNPIEEQEMQRLLNDAEHYMQEKFDGKGVLLRKENGQAVGINRKGLTIGLASSIIKSAEQLRGDFILDGECVGDVLYVFDLLESDGKDLRPLPYRERGVELANLLTTGAAPHLELVPTAFSPAEKKRMLDLLRQSNKEGVVFKRLDAPYTSGRPNSGGPQVKYKFYASLSAVVERINSQRSVELRLFNGQSWQCAGNVTIPPGEEVPVAGTVVEVRYLYAYRESGALYQPVYLGTRHDVAQQECIVSQIKYKSVNDEEEP